jgi:hypothetical protein
LCAQTHVITHRVMQGIVVKSLQSPYVPNERKTWGKIKPDYVDGMGYVWVFVHTFNVLCTHSDDFDMLIVGAFYGSGKRAEYARAPVSRLTTSHVHADCSLAFCWPSLQKRSTRPVCAARRHSSKMAGRT